MSKAFVGIISSRGLESMVPETDHALPFLIRRAYRREPPETVCYWAVMDEAVAEEVRRQLQGHCHEDAFLVIQTLAECFGTIPPPLEDDAG
jgi:hypothetical protein